VECSGPNLSSRLDISPTSSVRKLTALNILASVIPVLDRMSVSSGHMYSLPKTVELKCNTGKTYHFWYTAFLARKAALETHNVRAAAVTTFQMAKAYRIFTYGGGGALPLTTASMDRPFTYIFRADFAYYAAGSVFGAASASGKELSLDVDFAIGKMIKTTGKGSAGSIVGIATSLAPESSSKLNDYKNWMELLNPNLSFNLLSGNL
jgi:hypothetical protein